MSKDVVFSGSSLDELKAVINGCYLYLPVVKVCIEHPSLPHTLVNITDIDQLYDNAVIVLVPSSPLSSPNTLHRYSRDQQTVRRVHKQTRDGSQSVLPARVPATHASPTRLPVEVQIGALLASTALASEALFAHAVFPAHHGLGKVLHTQLLPGVVAALQRLQRLLACLARFPHTIDIATEVRERIGTHEKMQQMTVLLHLWAHVLKEGREVLVYVVLGVLCNMR